MNNRFLKLLARAGLGCCLLATLVVATGGCTPDAYREDADFEVGRILRDRKQRTLNYQPEAVADTSVPEKPVRAAYHKIPSTPAHRNW